jgi:ketosteroid isomerase-like protein
MKTLANTLSLCLLTLAMAGTTQAQDTSAKQSHDHAPKAAAETKELDIAPGTEAAVAAADRFGDALKAGDMQAVEALLDPKVLILESGGAERSREEYLSHHAISDAAFLKGTHSQLLRRTARRDGDTVWIGSESELHASKDGKPLTLRSTETMILRQSGDHWYIVHIHWSSRPKK